MTNRRILNHLAESSFFTPELKPRLALREGAVARLIQNPSTKKRTQKTPVN